jgi:hypothetical protein
LTIASGEAVVLASSRPGPRHREDIAAGEADVSDFGLGRHTLRLEVRLPDREPYEVEGLFKVPPRVQFGRRVPFLARPLAKRSAVPVGLTLPVEVDPTTPEEVTIDWDGFLEKGGKAEMKRASEDRAAEKLHRDNPEQSAQQRENAKRALETWVAAVQNGTLKRKTFDQSVDTQVKLGYLDPADAEAARQRLDA